MENTISNIYSVDIYGQLHLEISTAACSFLQKFDLGGGKNDASRNSLKSLLSHLHYIRLSTDECCKMKAKWGGGGGHEIFLFLSDVYWGGGGQFMFMNLNPIPGALLVVNNATSLMPLLRDMKPMSRNRIFLSRDKSVDLTGVSSCRATLFECLRHNLLNLREVSCM